MVPASLKCSLKRHTLTPAPTQCPLLHNPGTETQVGRGSKVPGGTMVSVLRGPSGRHRGPPAPEKAPVTLAMDGAAAASGPSQATEAGQSPSRATRPEAQRLPGHSTEEPLMVAIHHPQEATEPRAALRVARPTAWGPPW